MQPNKGQTFHLVDAEQRQLGQIAVEDRKDRLVFGRFAPGPAFPNVERLFRDFEEAVDAQALGVVDDLDAAIARLGLMLRSTDGSDSVEVHDVQIWSDGDVTFQLCSKSASPSRKTPKSADTVAAISARSA